MPPRKKNLPTRKHLIISFTVTIALILAWLFLHLSAPKPIQSTFSLSPMSQAPNWSELAKYQGKIDKKIFQDQLQKIFTFNDSWREFLTFQSNSVLITTRNPDNTPPSHFILRFRNPNITLPSPPPLSSTRPLEHIHIAIDPGHLGGRWAKMEERFFQIANQQPICEGDLTLQVAKILQAQLEALGATITLIRKDDTPTTKLRPKDFLAQTANEPNPQKSAEKLFYRTAEIHARANLVNSTIKPDLVLCLHFNALAWGDPAHPSLVDASHFHLLVNGGYSSPELSYEDQRFAMLEKLCQNTFDTEFQISREIAQEFEQHAKIPIYRYPENAQNARPTSNPAVWARNLLANRTYRCPVIFLEPYLMNGRTDYARIQAGDFSGKREVLGEMRTSIFREYADCITKGLLHHFKKNRTTH